MYLSPFTKHVLSPTGTGKFILSFGCCFLYRMYTDNSDIQVAFHNFLLLLSVTCRDSMSASSTRTICSSQSSYCSLNLFVPCQISEGCRTVAGWQNCYTHLSSQLTDEIASEVRQSFLKSPSELINSFWWTLVWSIPYSAQFNSCLILICTLLLGCSAFDNYSYVS